MWSFIAVRESEKICVLVRYWIASNKIGGESLLCVTVFATARPHKLKCYPCGNKESTLKGIKIRHRYLGKLIWH